MVDAGSPTHVELGGPVGLPGKGRGLAPGPETGRRCLEHPAARAWNLVWMRVQGESHRALPLCDGIVSEDGSVGAIPGAGNPRSLLRWCSSDSVPPRVGCTYSCESAVLAGKGGGRPRWKRLVARPWLRDGTRRTPARGNARPTPHVGCPSSHRWPRHRRCPPPPLRPLSLALPFPDSATGHRE